MVHELLDHFAGLHDRGARKRGRGRRVCHRLSFSVSVFYFPYLFSYPSLFLTEEFMSSISGLFGLGIYSKW
jgi:hypothetical protein